MRKKLLSASGVYGFWPAASDGDDIVLYRDRGQSSELVRFNFLRQQEMIADGKPNLSLADSVAPRPAPGGQTDYVGAFAVTAGLGADALARRFEADHNDYDAILVKAGDSVYMPAGYGHLVVNTGAQWLVTSDDSPVEGPDDSASMPGHADYESVKKMRGFAYYVVEKDGKPALIANPLYKEVRKTDAGGLPIATL